MNVYQVVKAVALVAGLLLALGILGGIGYMTAALSVRTVSVPLLVEMNLVDRETNEPVAHCLLGFEKGGVSTSSPSTLDEGQTTLRSDAQGRLLLSKTYSYRWSALWAFERQRSPAFRFYIGEAPHYGTIDEVETWLVETRFEEPWRASNADIAPVVLVKRSLAHEESRARSGGVEPLAAEPVERLARTRIRVEASGYGQTAYRLLVSVFLDRKAIAACQGPTLGDIKKSAAELYNAHRFEASLQAFREVARRDPYSAWAHRGVADGLQQLSRPREALAHYRKAIELDPKDPDNLYWYANCLIGLDDKEAIEQFRKLVGVETDKARGWIGLGIASYGVDRFAESVEAFEKAAKLCAECLSSNDRAVYADSKRLAR